MVAPILGTCMLGAGAMSATVIHYASGGDSASYGQFFTGTYIIDTYPVHSASGTAASTLLRSILSSLAPLLSKKMYDRLEVGWTLFFLATIVLVVAPVPWIVYCFGEGWRKPERLSRVAMSEVSATGRRNAGDTDSWSELPVVVGKQQV
jgi:hypothetical protein